MELRDIEYFLAVCRTMNFTRAAEQCGVAQPTLTRAIQKLERELGGLLVARERNLTHLTPLGRLVQPQLEELATRSRNLRRQAQQHARLDCADLRIGVMCSVGPQRFGRFFSRFRADHPGVEIMLADATPERLAERLLQGEFDAAVTVVPAGFGERLQVEPLYAERFVVACGPDHPFALRNSISMRDMDGQSYLMRINCEHTEVLEEALRAAGAKLVLAARSEREDWIQALTAAGMGVCFLPEFSAAMPGLVACRVEDSPVARQVCLLTVAGRRWSAAMARFVEALRRARWDG
ncbi:LysR family transcriptional regulator [Falsiroseomonas sp.]|uniref:LysR family transcriptional regulator n=1 Tax=Falsiroseomonas sp. TaxID=2870721 RepID=UPI00356ABC88